MEIQKLQSFIEGAQAIVDKAYTTEKATLSLEEGKKYIRVVKSVGSSKSAFCFIDKTSGNILMAASWSTPAKNKARSNINDETNGLRGITSYGAVYLR